MKCLYPDVKHSTAYHRGCRCPDCRSFKRESNNKSVGAPWEERKPGIQKKYPVPAKPILDLIEDWMQRNRGRYQDPTEGLAQELKMKTPTAWKMLSRMRRQTTYMSFAQADRIISALSGPHFWYTNDELLAIYEEHA